MKTNKKGFTLVELMVVVIIVGILAAVAVPLMSANRERAIATEATAVLGTLNSNARMWASSTGQDIDDATITLMETAGFVNTADFDGTYFDNADFVDANVAWDAAVDKFEATGLTGTDGKTYDISWDDTAKAYVSVTQ